MAPRALTPITRTVNTAPARTPGVSKLTNAPQKAQVLQTGRAPAQLSLFLRPVGAR